MSNFKVGNSKFSRFLNGKGFYIALALCLVAIGSAAYIAVNNTGGITSNYAKNSKSSVSSYGPIESFPSWSSDSTQQTAGTVSGVPSSNSESASSDTAKTSASGAPSKMVLTMPVQGTIITPYSNGNPVLDKTTDDYRAHDAIDISAPEGTPVKACGDGTVTDVKIDDSDNMLGQMVIIDHGNGLMSIYANLTNQVTVKKGQHVSAGDAIGCVGGTAQGESAIASHLHFAMQKNGIYVDPVATINAK